MSKYSYLTIKDYIFKNKDGILDYSKCIMLIEDFNSILKYSMLILEDESLNQDENLIYDLIKNNGRYGQIVKDYNNDIIKDIINKAINMYNNGIISDQLKDINIKYTIKNKYIYNNLLDTHNILLKDQYHNLSFKFFRNANNALIKDIKIYNKYDQNKVTFDITYKTLNNDYDKIDNNNLSIYYDMYNLSFVIGSDYYIINIEDIVNFTYEIMVNLNIENKNLKILSEFGYYSMLNNIYNLADLIINKYGKDNKVQTIISYNHDDNNKLQYFYKILDKMINYLAQSNNINVKKYNINSQVLSYVESFKNKLLMKQNIKPELSQLKDGIEVFYNYEKDKYLPIVANAAFNLQKHYNKNYNELYNINFESHDISRYIQFITYKIN